MPKVNRILSQLTKGLIPRLKNKDSSKKAHIKSSDPTPSKDEAMKCEIKHLDLLYDDRDEQYYAERKKEVKKPEQKDWWRLFAFCLVRVYYDDGEVDTTRLYVNHQPLRQLLSDVIGDYPDDPIDVDDVQIEIPYYSLFYYRKELETEGLDRFKGDEESTAQLRLLVKWIQTHFEQDITAYEKCVSGGLRAISFDQLWTLFPPKEIIHAKVLNQHRGFQVQSCWYDEGETPVFSLWASFVDFDGEKLGTRKAELFVPKYAGTRQLAELTTMPLALLADADEIRAALVDRGRKFEGYVGQHFAQYDGAALRKTEQGYARTNVRGRVMVDCETYHRLEANDTFDVVELGSSGSSSATTASGNHWMHKMRPKAVNNIGFTPEAKTFEKLSNDDAAVANATVRGYAFSAKQFLEFFVDLVAPIEWNARCFDDLVLDQDTKKTVQAVVSTHASSRDGFDDIVKGKGQGLVCVLQ